MSTKVSLSENTIKGLKLIQDDYLEIQELIYRLEDYIIAVENDSIPAKETLLAIRAVKKIEKYFIPIEF